MSLTNLKQYVEQQNKWNSIFGGRVFSILVAKDRQEIARSIDSDLSPENLYCDGEISAAEANRKYRFLTQVAQELQSIDPTVKFYEYN